MNLNPIPILCAACNARIELRYDQLDKPMACAKCGEPIRIKDYDILLEAKKWLEESRKAEQRAEKQRLKREADERKALERQERERLAEIEHVDRSQDRELTEQQKALRQSEKPGIPEYPAIRVLAVCIRIVGGIIAAIGIALILVALFPSGSDYLPVTVGASCVFGGLLYVAVGELMAAIRDMARNTAFIAKHTADAANDRQSLP